MSMPIPDGSVIITPAQMYNELQATRAAVEKLTNTIDPAMVDMRNDVAALQKSDSQHGTRLTILETKVKVAWALIGLAIMACAALGAILGAVHH